MTISGNPKDRMDDFADVSEVDSAVEEKKVDENADGHKEEASESIWDQGWKLIAETQQLIDEGRKKCEEGIELAKEIIEKKKSKEQLEEDKKKLNRN